MHHLTRTLALAAVLCAGGLSAGLAQARDVDVQWSITIGSPVYTRPAPVVVAAPPIHVPARPVYAPAPIYAPAPVYGQRVVVVPGPPRNIGHYRHAHRPTRWDVDGDGIPNRHDRAYNPRWDHDGDGVPNRRDAYPQRPGRY